MIAYTSLRRLLPLAAAMIWLPIAAGAIETPPFDAAGPLALRALLSDGDTTEIERRFEDWHARRESRVLEGAYRAFFSLTQAESRALETWQAARPDSPVAQLALATHEFGRAGRARGQTAARQVKEQGWAQMRVHCARALELANEAARLAPTRVEPHVLRMEIARLIGDRALARTAFEEGFAIDPSHFDLWWTYMRGYERRWGGSYEALQQLADAAQVYAPANPRLRDLLALPFGDRAQDAVEMGRLDEGRSLYDAAADRGQLSWVYLRRGGLRHYQGDLSGALADYDRALALVPWDDVTHAARARALWGLERTGEALAAMRLAAQLEPAEADYPSDLAKIEQYQLDYERWLAEQQRWEDFKRNPNLPEALEYSVRYAWDHAVDGLCVAVVAWLGWRGWLYYRRRLPANLQSLPVPAQLQRPPHPELPGMVASLLRAVLLVIALIHVWHYGMNFREADLVANGLDLPITAVAIVGALAYAHGKRLSTPELWRVWAVLFPAWNVTYHFVFQGATLAEWPSWGFVHVESLPVYLALFLYGFRARALWEPGGQMGTAPLTALGADTAPRR